MWITKANLFQITQKARFDGMNEAADSLVRGMSPYFEGEDGSIPGPVVKALQSLDEALHKSRDFNDLANACQASLMILGNAIGEACKAKTNRG